jgi:hypothetical protein
MENKEMQEYTIKELKELLTQHALDYDDHMKEIIEDDPLEEHLYYFNLSKALVVIIEEIEKLKTCCK